MALLVEKGQGRWTWSSHPWRLLDGGPKMATTLQRTEEDSGALGEDGESEESESSEEDAEVSAPQRRTFSAWVVRHVEV